MIGIAICPNHHPLASPRHQLQITQSSPPHINQTSMSVHTTHAVTTRLLRRQPQGRRRRATDFPRTHIHHHIMLGLLVCRPHNNTRRQAGRQAGRQTGSDRVRSQTHHAPLVAITAGRSSAPWLSHAGRQAGSDRGRTHIPHTHTLRTTRCNNSRALFLSIALRRTVRLRHAHHRGNNCRRRRLRNTCDRRCRTMRCW